MASLNCSSLNGPSWVRVAPVLNGPAGRSSKSRFEGRFGAGPHGLDFQALYG